MTSFTSLSSPFSHHSRLAGHFADIRAALSRSQRVGRWVAMMTGFATAFAVATAAEGLEPAEPVPTPAVSETQRLMEGDDIRIAFPGAANLDTVQKIRSDGMISAPLIGEIRAAGLTPLELQQLLVGRYVTELVNNQVMVSVVASTYPVYVSGAVLNPGEVRCDRPTTVLEAIMKAGGFDPQRAKLDKIIVIRRGEKNREINLKAILQGKAEDDFFLKPSDKIMVPDKAIWF